MTDTPGAVPTSRSSLRAASFGGRDVPGRLDDYAPGMEDGILLPSGEGEKVARGPDRHHRILAELPELEVVELCFGPDFEGVDLHTHADHVDSFYVLEGEAEFLMGDEVVRVGPGGYVAAPIGVAHGFRNAGAGDLRMLNVHAPNVGFAGRLRQG